MQSKETMQTCLGSLLKNWFQLIFYFKFKNGTKWGKKSRNAEENVEIDGLTFWNFAINLIKEFSDFKKERYMKLKKKKVIIILFWNKKTEYSWAVLVLLCLGCCYLSLTVTEIAFVLCKGRWTFYILQLFHQKNYFNMPFFFFFGKYIERICYQLNSAWTIVLPFLYCIASRSEWEHGGEAIWGNLGRYWLPSLVHLFYKWAF